MRIVTLLVVSILLIVPAFAQESAPDAVEFPDFELPVGDDASEAWAAWRDGDYTKARSLAAVAGANEDASAQLLFGILLDKGLGGDEDPANAVNWYKAAAKNGQVNGWLALAGMAFSQRGGLSDADGRAFLTHAANAHSPEAMLELGKVNASGLGGPPDEKQAEFWFSQAINQGVNPARVALADLYLAQNKPEQALALYQTAVFGGSQEAALKAGLLQADPESSVYAPQQAKQQLLTAARSGRPKAMTTYGLFLATNTPPLPATAVRWFRKAANANEAEGQYLFAVSLAKGEGVVKDRKLAYEWALRASDNAPDQTQYARLAEVLGQALTPEVRDLIHARSQMPLVIAHTRSTGLLDPVPSAD